MHNSKLAIGVATLLALSLTAACSDSGGDEASETESITFAGYGGETQDHITETLQKPFTEESGIEVKNISPTSNAEIKLQVESGNYEYDVTDTGFGHCDDLFEPLPEGFVDEVAVYGEEYANAFHEDCGVIIYLAPTVQLYNTEMFADNPPQTIADFFDLEKYPGKRLMAPYPDTGMLEFALMADGVAPEDLYPLDVERAFAKLETIKDVAVFPESYGASQQAMVAGDDIAMALAIASRATYAVRDGATFEPVWDKTSVTPDYFKVLKGTPNADAAFEFIKFALEPGPQAALAEAIGLPPANTAAQPERDEFGEMFDINAEGNDVTIVPADAKWWAENIDSIYEEWTSFTTG